MCGCGYDGTGESCGQPRIVELRTLSFIFSYFLKIYLFEREHVVAGMRWGEEEGKRESQVHSPLSVDLDTISISQP